MPPILIHSIFDVVATASSLTATILIYNWRLKKIGNKIDSIGGGYFIALVLGAIIGGFGFGTGNLLLSGVENIGRSIAGAFFGAIVSIEWFKHRNKISGSTGIIFVPAFCVTLVIGRLGCFYSGLDDQTFGIQSNLPWAVDLGDGIRRHPVQLYESAMMLIFLTTALILLARRNVFFINNGFYLLAIWYGTQRFLWEFLKPYGKIIGPFNLFHFVCLALIIYGCWMILQNLQNKLPTDRKPA